MTSQDPPPASSAAFARFQKAMRAGMDKPATTDPALTRAMDRTYRPGATVGSGSTAAAVRYERATSGTVGGKRHTQKAEELVLYPQCWLLDNPAASPRDRAAAENVLRDLWDALAGN